MSNLTDFFRWLHNSKIRLGPSYEISTFSIDLQLLPQSLWVLIQYYVNYNHDNLLVMIVDSSLNNK